LNWQKYARLNNAGKEKKKKELIDNLGKVYEDLQVCTINRLYLH